jgi:hypothetical protein
MAEFSLPFPPIPENAPKIAEVIVETARDISQVELDYSVESLKAVDDIIEGFRADGSTSGDMATSLFCFGCYVGEVFVRNVNAVWRSTEEAEMEVKITSWPLVLELEDGTFCNPIGKAFKRMDHGSEDSVAYFYHVFTSGPGEE